MIRRPAISLVEVLAALFIVGIGMIALLTLFPLGALTMAQAIKDGRCAQAGANATALAVMFNYDLRNDQGRTPQPIYAAMSQGIKNTDLPSYPVYVDPIGFVSMSANRAKLGGTIPRVSPAYISQSNSMAKDIMLLYANLDDMNFDPNGQPSAPFGKVQRQGAFSWAYMLQRPRLADRSVVNLTVVVYQGRGLGLTGNVLDQTEPVVPASGAQGGNTIMLSTGTPPLKRGGWVLDCSPSTSQMEQQQYGPVHAFFYRVSSVLQGSGSVTLETETPLRASVSKVVAMLNVAEVFEKGPGWLP